MCVNIVIDVYSRCVESESVHMYMYMYACKATKSIQLHVQCTCNVSRFVLLSNVGIYCRSGLKFNVHKKEQEG